MSFTSEVPSISPEDAVLVEPFTRLIDATEAVVEAVNSADSVKNEIAALVAEGDFEGRQGIERLRNITVVALSGGDYSDDVRAEVLETWDFVLSQYDAFAAAQIEAANAGQIEL